RARKRLFFAYFRFLNKSKLKPARRPGQGRISRASAAGALFYRRGKLGKEVVGELLGGAIDQPLTELRELAANLRLDIVGQQRAAVLLGELDGSTPLGEAGDAAVALAGNLVAVRRVEVGEPDLALEARLDRADLVGGDRLEFVFANQLKRLAAGDARLQHLRIVELLPDRLPRSGKLLLAGHHHRHCQNPFACAGR